MSFNKDNLDSARARLVELTDGRGMNLTALSRAIGRNPGYLRDYIRKHSPAKLDEDERAKIAEILGCDPSEFRPAMSDRTAARVSVPPTPSSQHIRILGRPAGGDAGWIIDESEPVGQTLRPPFLYGANDAYALYVFDETMSPAFEPGHLIWADPARPVRYGDDIVLRYVDGRATVRRVIKRTAKGLTTQQWNPTKREDVALSLIAGAHLIIGSLRLRG